MTTSASMKTMVMVTNKTLDSLYFRVLAHLKPPKLYWEVFCLQAAPRLRLTPTLLILKYPPT